MIKLTLVERDKEKGIKEKEIWVNPDHVVCVFESDPAQEGKSRVIFDNDQGNYLLAKESAEEVARRMRDARHYRNMGWKNGD